MGPSSSASADQGAVAPSRAGAQRSTALRAAAVMAGLGALLSALGWQGEMGEAFNLAPFFALAFAGMVLVWITVHLWLDRAFVRAREGQPFRSSRESWTLTGTAAALALPVAAASALFTGALLFRLEAARSSAGLAAAVGVLMVLLLALVAGAVAGWRARGTLERSADASAAASSSAPTISSRRPGWREAALWSWLAAVSSLAEGARLPVWGVTLLVVPLVEGAAGAALWLAGRRLRWGFLIAFSLWVVAGTVHRVVYAPPELYRLLLVLLPWVVTTTAWCVAFFLLLRDDVSPTARLAARVLLVFQLGSSLLLSLGLVQ